jgi:hypothetical protein
MLLLIKLIKTNDLLMDHLETMMCCMCHTANQKVVSVKEGSRSVLR